MKSNFYIFTLVSILFFSSTLPMNQTQQNQNPNQSQGTLVKKNNSSLECLKEIAENSPGLIKPKTALVLLLKLINDEQLTGNDLYELIDVKEIAQIAKKYGYDSEFVDEIIRHITDQPSRRNEYQKSLESISQFGHREQFRGFLLGAGGIFLTWLLGHGLCHSCMETLEPTSFFTAIPLAASLAYLIYKAQNAIKIQKGIKDLLFENCTALLNGIKKNLQNQ